MSHDQLLAQIPSRLLERDRADHSARAETRRAIALESWCVSHGFRPSLLDLEDERRRRGLRR